MKPHAYYVEHMVNPGTRSERWERDPESDYCTTREHAEADRTLTIQSGYALDQVRVVAVVALTADEPEPTVLPERDALLRLLAAANYDDGPTILDVLEGTNP